jgi:hypothetical protein
MTIGDVLAVVAGVIGLCVSLWGMLMASVLLFGGAAERGKDRLQAHPTATLLTGAALAGTAGFFGIVLLNQANGLLKLVGWVMLLGLFALGALGSGGVALLVSVRMRGVDSSLSPLASLSRGAGVLVLAGQVPLIGWFLIIPVLVLLSLGLGANGLRPRRATRPTPLPLTPEREMETVG